MSKDDPEHRDCFDSIEDVEIIVLVGEYLEGEVIVKGLYDLILHSFLLLLLSPSASHKGKYSHQEEGTEENDCDVEPSSDVILYALGIDFHGPYSQRIPN